MCVRLVILLLLLVWLDGDILDGFSLAELRHREVVCWEARCYRSPEVLRERRKTRLDATKYFYAVLIAASPGETVLALLFRKVLLYRYDKASLDRLPLWRVIQ